MDDVLTAGVAAGTGILGAIAGWVTGQSQPKKVNVLVNQELLNYLQTIFNSKAGDPSYNSLLDVNHDGVIDVLDAIFFSTRLGQIVTLDVP